MILLKSYPPNLAKCFTRSPHEKPAQARVLKSGSNYEVHHDGFQRGWEPYIQHSSRCVGVSAHTHQHTYFKRLIIHALSSLSTVTCVHNPVEQLMNFPRYTDGSCSSLSKSRLIMPASFPFKYTGFDHIRECFQLIHIQFMFLLFLIYHKYSPLYEKMRSTLNGRKLLRMSQLLFTVICQMG